MINCCANPNCSTGYCESTREKMSVAKGRSGLEFFWLCHNCAPHYDLALGAGKRVRLRPRPETGRMSLIQLQIEHPTHITA
jgi:hypothetical protein